MYDNPEYPRIENLMPQVSSFSVRSKLCKYSHCIAEYDCIRRSCYRTCSCCFLLRGTSPIIRSLAVKSTRVDNHNTMERTNEFPEN